MRLHYIPNRAFSYPSGGKRRPNLRMFFPQGNVPVCGLGAFDAEGTDEPDKVTCATCRKRMATGRFDTDAVIKEVLDRGTTATELPGVASKDGNG